MCMGGYKDICVYGGYTKWLLSPQNDCCHHKHTVYSSQSLFRRFQASIFKSKPIIKLISIVFHPTFSKEKNFNHKFSKEKNNAHFDRFQPQIFKSDPIDAYFDRFQTQIFKCKQFKAYFDRFPTQIFRQILQGSSFHRV